MSWVAVDGVRQTKRRPPEDRGPIRPLGYLGQIVTALDFLSQQPAEGHHGRTSHHQEAHSFW